jgi:DNA polymerase-3 subunit epsilon
VYDTETTGLDVQKDRICQVGFQMWTAEGLTKEYKTLVRPGVQMPEGAQKTHGITDALLEGCRHCKLSREEHDACNADDDDPCGEFKPWPTFAQLATSLVKGFTDCDFAGKNIRYDLRITAAEFERNGVEWSYAGARIIDADRLEQLGEPRTLSHLYEKHLGEKLEDAHDALVDVRATTSVLAAQLRKYQSALPRDLDALHDLQWPGWSIDPDGKFRFVDGVACCTFGKWKGKPMSAIEPSYWDWIIKSDFSKDIKELAKQAKLGKFPRPK